MAKQGLPYRAISQTRDAIVGGVMLDLGANIGATAIPRAILGDARLVLCAEPDELNYRCLVANITRNRLEGLVLPEQVAIGDRVGTAALARGKMPGSHRVVHGAVHGVVSGDAPAAADAVAVAPPASSAGPLVRSTTLDAWLAQHDVAPADVTFVKVDTQGSELHVLNGAAGLLRQAQVTWQIELAPRLLQLAGSEPAQLYGLLRERFTHFIDLNPDASGERLRPIADLAGALDYLDGGAIDQTDLVLYRVP
jgi:FkbM family methyltransferase